MNKFLHFVSRVITLHIVIAGNISCWVWSPGRVSNEESVRFFHYPSRNFGYEIFAENARSVYNSKLLPSAATVLLIDGFLSNGTTPMPQTLKNAFLQDGKFPNVIVVDWGGFSGNRDRKSGNIILAISTYARVVQNIDDVGEIIGRFLQLLRAHKAVSFSDVYLCGHSLGAHIAGATGDFIRRNYGQRLRRITGLDPAGPLFSSPFPLTRRLNKGDAKFVDVYHSNRGILGDKGTESGHVNVFINGGKKQPGCDVKDQGGLLGGACSHSYSWMFFDVTFRQYVAACPCRKSACECRLGCGFCYQSVPVGVHIPNIRGTWHVNFVTALQ